MSTTIKLLDDRVLVEPSKADEKTSSGLYIPDTAKERPSKGVVIAVGPGNEETKMEISIGDTILYGKYSGTEFELNNKEYLIMRQSDVFGILK